MRSSEQHQQRQSTHNPSSVAEILAALRRRQRLLNALRFAGHGLLYGMVASLALAVAAWIGGGRPGLGSQTTVWLAALVIGGLGFALIGGLLGLVCAIDPLRLARALDKAADSEDRLASAVQLSSHPRRDRAELIAKDALDRVRNTPTAAALPMRLPRSLRWIPVPVIALVCLLLLPAQTPLEAAPPPPPEISDEQWTQLHDELVTELQQLPKPQSPEEEQLQREFENLAAMLKQKPEKKDVLKEIARLSERLQRQRQSLGSRDFSMKNAARAMSQSQSLKQFASLLKQGEYDKAAASLENLAQQMKENAVSPDAAEFESIAADMEQMAAQMASQQEMQNACQNCAGAASSMNRQSLAEAMRRLAEQLKQNSDNLRQCDKCSSCSSLLDQLKRRMSQCSSCSGCKSGNCKNGNCQGNCSGPGQGKGGLRAGWGSAANWKGGGMAAGDESRTVDVADVSERAGQSDSFRVVSPDERANSAQTYQELYAEFVQKAEADLDLESVPVAYREYLRRYFNSIRPQEEVAAEEE